MPIGEKEHFGNCYVLTLLAEVFIISYFIKPDKFKTDSISSDYTEN